MHLSSSFLFLIVLGLACSSVQGGRKTTGAIVAGAGTGAAVGIGFGAMNAGQAQQGRGSIQWTTPNLLVEDWECGKSYNVNAITHFIGSFWGLSDAKLSLIKADGSETKPFPLWNGKLSELVDEERFMGIGIARTGKINQQVTVPSNIPPGAYVIEYESANALDWDISRIKLQSPPFKIKCGAQPQLQQPENNLAVAPISPAAAAA